MSGESLISPANRMEQLSVCYVRAVASYCGFDSTKPNVDDDSIDITLSSSAGKKPKLDIQLKSTARIQDIASAHELSFALPIKNYNDLRVETLNPRILVVLYMPNTQEEWIKHSSEELALRKCAYWVSLSGKPETSNKESITVTLPIGNVFSPQALNEIMQKVNCREELCVIL